jgi:hypothetical protein
MAKVIRYVIKMRNGDYMKQEFHETVEKVKIYTVDLPIHADLFKDKNTAQRVLDEILSGNTNLLVIYNDDNPPVEVVEVEINYEIQS